MTYGRQRFWALAKTMASGNENLGLGSQPPSQIAAANRCCCGWCPHRRHPYTYIAFPPVTLPSLGENHTCQKAMTWLWLWGKQFSPDAWRKLRAKPRQSRKSEGRQPLPWLLIVATCSKEGRLPCLRYLWHLTLNQLQTGPVVFQSDMKHSWSPKRKECIEKENVNATLHFTEYFMQKTQAGCTGTAGCCRWWHWNSCLGLTSELYQNGWSAPWKSETYLIPTQNFPKQGFTSIFAILCSALVKALCCK